MSLPLSGIGGARLPFGSVAERYERFRPGYPDELVDVVLRYAGRPVRSAVEVGAGTGKATRLFAARGIEVTAVEPDPDMARVLGRTTRGLPVHPVATTFDQFCTDRTVDLVYAAASWHWLDPATRWARAVDLLVPGGVLALFGRIGEPTDRDLFAAVEDIEGRLLPTGGPPAQHPWSLAAAARVDGLADAAYHDLRGVAVTTASEFVGRLGTVSAYLALDPRRRADALGQVRAVLPEQFEIDTTVQVCLARRTWPAMEPGPGPAAG